MSRVVRAGLITLFCLNFFAPRARACGYDFIGDCSTSIGLKINGTLDSFIVAECPFGKVFNGLDLGVIQNLNLAHAKGVTWESCQNNVSGLALYYRVYEQGQNGPSWQTLQLAQDYFTLVGPYTTRYRSKNTNVSLSNGLTSGKHYVLEIYWRAEIDTIGDDFVPETFIVQNNNGQNYKLLFEYGGASAPPFSVVETQHQNIRCYGDSTGIAGVSVYGNQSNLFYTWSGYNNNFPALSNLSAGTYTVTVSGVNGYTQSRSIQITQPPQIQNQFVDIQPIACNGQGGSATALSTGGVAPLQYLWSTGATTQSSPIPFAGAWQLTVTDANACNKVFSVQVPGGIGAELNLYREICAGESLFFEGNTYTQAGLYDIIDSGPGGCDTIKHLTLAVLAPAGLLAGLPSDVSLDCNQATVELCMAQQAGAAYLWTDAQNGALANSACLEINSDGYLTAAAWLSGQNIACVASATIAVQADFQQPAFTFTVFNASGPSEADGSIWVKASGGAPPYAIIWDAGSVPDSVLVVEGLQPGQYCFTVEGANGCTTTDCATVSFSSAVEEASELAALPYPNPVRAGETVHLSLLKNRSFEYTLIDAQGRLLNLHAIATDGGNRAVVIPEQAGAGPAFLQIKAGSVRFGLPLLILPK